MASHGFHGDYYSLTSIGWVAEHMGLLSVSCDRPTINSSSKATTQLAGDTTLSKCWTIQGEIPGTKSEGQSRALIDQDQGYMVLVETGRGKPAVPSGLLDRELQSATHLARHEDP